MTGPGAGAWRTGPRGPRRRALSLRARLTLVATLAVAVVLVAGALALSAALGTARTAALDDVVRERSQTLAALVADDRVPDALPVRQPGEVAQLLDASGRVLATSATASRTLPVVDPATLAAWRERAGDDVLVVGTDAGAYDEVARAAVRAVTWRGEPATLVTTVPATDVQGVLRALRVALLLVVPVLTVGFAVVLWTVLGRALAPVEQLRSAADRVALAGGPGALPVPPVDDELAALARTLNSMLDRLEVAAARQRTFVADAAHELRSPVAAARAAVEVAAAHPGAYPVDDLVADLTPQVARMQTLVDDLLVLARVGASDAPREPVDLAAVAADVAAGLATAARERDVRVDVHGAGTATATVEGATRVVRNLVANAVRHARSRVTVTVAPGPGVVRVLVDDDGTGIAPADRERVFERFVRLDEARERDAGGAGLGLAIAREVARDLGGDVRVADAPGAGTRTVLELPAG
ncbi:HAMP domain-containing histidine kinase [Cellulomonas sp. zg-ZUI222]|uniref:sensor histidine kinase n=1 Tax=Cellulomonas wangleii TaxID=2816956 RepID=UPI001A94EBA3|nr:HAMP domain-containing sensor histidine kinase [Cellulomonas wangleii]MBO0921570.1 HAMP domain-containing histidine kinase [Cellulomonas wangleii]